MTTSPVLQPGAVEKPAGNIPLIQPASATLFSERARRLRQWAARHSLGDYLWFIATLAECQQQALETHPSLPLPNAALLEQCLRKGLEPLNPAQWPRHPHWLKLISRFTERVLNEVPPLGRSALSSLLNPDRQGWLETQADRLLAGQLDQVDPATAPIIGATLQVQWTFLALRMDLHSIPPRTPATHCPVCGSRPVASLLHARGAFAGLRTLQCSLCATQWYRVRAGCCWCDSTRPINWFSLEGEQTSVRAEACSDCRTYLKQTSLAADPLAEPAADDLATLALDLLMNEQGFQKNGMNFSLVQGPAHLA